MTHKTRNNVTIETIKETTTSYDQIKQELIAKGQSDH